MSKSTMVFIGAEPHAAVPTEKLPDDEELLAFARKHCGPPFAPTLIAGRVHVSPRYYVDRVDGQLQILKLEDTKGPR